MTDSDIQEYEAQGQPKAPATFGVSPTVIEAGAFPRAHREPPLEVLELQNRLKIRSDICGFLIRSLGFSTVCCFGLIILQGFQPFGFQMDAALLKWLCGATIAQSGVLLSVFTNAVWQKTSRNPDKISRNSP